MKYLGLTLNSRWNFRAHFDRLAPRIKSTAVALSGLLPNLGEPSRSCRRLYMGMVRSMALYGAPVWLDALDKGENLPLEGVPENYSHTGSERVPHHLLRGGVRIGRVCTLGPRRRTPPCIGGGPISAAEG